MKLSLWKGMMILATTATVTVVSYAKNPDTSLPHHPVAFQLVNSTSLGNNVVATRRNIVNRNHKNVVTPKYHGNTTVMKKTTIQANRIIVNNRPLVHWTTGTGIALTAGAYCYVERYGNGTIKERKCYIAGRGYNNFYVVAPR